MFGNVGGQHTESIPHLGKGKDPSKEKVTCQRLRTACGIRRATFATGRCRSCRLYAAIHAGSWVLALGSYGRAISDFSSRRDWIPVVWRRGDGWMIPWDRASVVGGGLDHAEPFTTSPPSATPRRKARRWIARLDLATVCPVKRDERRDERSLKKDGEDVRFCSEKPLSGRQKGKAVFEF